MRPELELNLLYLAKLKHDMYESIKIQRPRNYPGTLDSLLPADNVRK